MHTLMFLGNDIACARRWQRLCMHMADLPAGVQRAMTIRSGRPRHRVRFLR